MNILSRLHRKAAGFLGKLLYTSLIVCGLGIGSTPAQAASVTVDPKPLIVQPSLPPNITLMLDDSGSMAWDYMPDACYLDGVTCTGTNNGTTPSGGGTDSISTVNNNAVIDANNNGVYYNPTVTYTAPPKADSTTATPDLYPSYSDITNVPLNGFNPGTMENLTNYSSSDLTGENNNQTKALNYSYSTTGTQNNTMSQAVKTTTSHGTTTTAAQACQNLFNSTTGTSGSYKSSYYTAAVPATNPASGTCVFPYTTPVTYSYFQYATGPVGTYAVNYVSATSSCNGQSSCTLASDTSGVAAPKGVVVGQNIANWFAYYHTRVQMAKSGLMSSFVNVNSTYRVGFGSIDGGANGDANNLPSSNQYSYNDSYNGVTNYIAEVQPFGDGTKTTDQKTAFWNWISQVSPKDGTPLREALDAVGQYYGTTQPWSTMSTDPAGNTGTELACRQSYTILTTDGFWNDSYSGVGDADGTAGTTVTGPNAQTYTYAPAAPYADVSNIKISYSTATCSSGYTLTAPKGAGNTSTTLYMCEKKNSGNSYSTKTPTCSSGTLSADQSKCATSNSYSNTLADVAMNYWETDLRPNTANEVPTSSEDPAFWQHMTTFTVGLGFTPTGITPAGTTISSIFTWADGGSAISGFSWPQPSSNSLYNIADLAHAAVNGHGGFYSATSPQAFTDGLNDALSRAASRVGTGASLAANSTQLQTGTVAYQANYFTSSWTGDLKAFSVDSTSGAISTTPNWTASQELPTAANRTIYTYNGSTYLAFQVATDGTLPALSTAQSTALSTLSGSATSETNMINYLRGDSSQDVANKGSYRNRTTPLGDIVDSQPVYAGAPDPDQFYTETFVGTSTFANYASTNSSRVGMIYVAANDGLLHGFNAGTGVEAYAYLPGAVITSGLTALADPQYGATVSHEYFNDGELTVADAYKSSDSTWHTILVGTTGRGLAEAVYALDVTDPSSIKFLWEHSSGDGVSGSNYIGQMTGKPVIAQTASGVWSVLIGNGYNSPKGNAALLQFDLFSGTLTVHQTTDTSGLAAPAVWMAPSGNGISTTAYAGDADGDVWSFTLNTNVGTTATATPSSAGVLLYTAKSAGSVPQPITAGMLVGQDAQTGNIWVFFGTGKYLSSADLTDLSTQTWYGLIVQSADPTINPSVTSGMTRANLAQRSITAQTAGTAAVAANPTANPPTPAVPATLPARTVTTAAAASSLTGQSGWYIDLTPPSPLVAQGERMVTPNQFEGDLLLGTTRIPEATDACNPSGQGWIMAVDPFTGTNPQASFFDVNGDGSINSSDTINGVPAAGIGFSSLPNNPIFVGSSMLTSFDNGTTSSIQTSSSTGGVHRVSWRELINQ